MKFRINAEVLSSYVNLVSKVVSSKANMPILNNLLLETSKDTLILTGTDLDIQITAKTPVTSEKDGQITVNSRLFSQYINTVPKAESVEIELDKSKLVVTSKVGSASFAVKDAEEFPLFETSDLEPLFEMDKAQLSQMIDKTVFAAAKEDIRPILTGVNFEMEGDYVTMVALDTFRLSKIATKVTNKIVGKKQFVISAFSLENVTRIANDSFVSSVADKDTVSLKASESGNYVMIEYGDVQIFSRFIEGDYPEYKQAIPVAHQTEITVNRSQMLDSLKRVGVFAQSAIGQKVIMNFHDGMVEMESVVPELGNVTEKLEVQIDGEPVKIAFQLKFLIDALSSLSDEVIQLRTINKNSAGLFLQKSLDTYLHLMMPLKLDD